MHHYSIRTIKGFEVDGQASQRAGTSSVDERHFGRTIIVQYLCPWVEPPPRPHPRAERASRGFVGVGFCLLARGSECTITPFAP